jgi:hypothetical protein
MTDSRSQISERMVPLADTGNVVTFHRDGLHLYAASGNSTTAVSCPAYTALPIGLTFILDNSHGTGSLTLTPTAGTACVIPADKVYSCTVAADGSLKAGELAAAPT